MVAKKKTYMQQQRESPNMAGQTAQPSTQGPAATLLGHPPESRAQERPNDLKRTMWY